MKFSFFLFQIIFLIKINWILNFTLANTENLPIRNLSEESNSKETDLEILKIYKMLNNIGNFRPSLTNQHSEELLTKLKDNKYRRFINLDDVDDLIESDLCLQCIRTGKHSDECMFCLLKYTISAAKRTKPSSKYWYTRSG
ncbi:unnamed protein product [Brachionus calyciflorus]|uniref:Uncharacterized protein n=1 Tax=Brachionus calyciflorus TaxID=104777 RepID=A0A814BB81_9BILA|nr:unnamed protein product [Brachionus calyciflorus]